MLTSAAYDQKALDVLAGDAKRGARAGEHGLHSPFALALFDALAKGDADLVPKGQGDGVITATELYLYLREQVEVQAEAQASHEQTPGLWPLNKHRKGEFIFLVPGHPLNLPPAPDLTDEANPYRGLKSYDQKHSPLFFGREDEIEELVALVDAAALPGRAGRVGHGQVESGEGGGAAAVGRGQGSGVRGQESGAGAGARTTADSIGSCRPCGPPISRCGRWKRCCAPNWAKTLAGLADGDDALAQIVARWAAAHPGQRLVLTVDQFEELVTLCRDDAERARFLRLLADGRRSNTPTPSASSSPCAPTSSRSSPRRTHRPQPWPQPGTPPAMSCRPWTSRTCAR